MNEFGNKVFEIVAFADGSTMGLPIDIRELTSIPGVALA
jgi:hypothetical protein